MQDKRDVFLHLERARPMVTSARPGDRLGDVLSQAGLRCEPGVNVFAGECIDALTDATLDGGEDAQEPCQVDGTLDQLGLSKGGPVVCHRCKRVAVSVNYQSGTKHRRFSPSATILTVTKWALRAFHLADQDAAKMVLQVCGTQQRPLLTLHVGELVAHPDCSVCFDLVPDLKIEGGQ